LGHFVKIFLNFETRFWEKVPDLLVANKEHHGRYNYFTCIDPKSYKKQLPDWPKNRNLLVGLAEGDEAQRLDTLSEDEVKDEIEALFTKIFSGDVKGEVSFRPSDIRLTRWSSNPLTLGAYSYFRTGAFCGDISLEHFLEPVDPSHMEDPLSKAADENSMSSDDFVAGRQPKLFFAGEAFDPLYRGYLQSAYLSGKRAAKQIMKQVAQ